MWPVVLLQVEVRNVTHDFITCRHLCREQSLQNLLVVEVFVAQVQGVATEFPLQALYALQQLMRKV